jgi:hypothetical protein
MSPRYPPGWLDRFCQQFPHSQYCRNRTNPTYTPQPKTNTLDPLKGVTSILSDPKKMSFGIAIVGTILLIFFLMRS